MRRVVVLCYGLLAYVAFLASFVVLGAFGANVGVVRGIDEGARGGWAVSVGVDVALIAVFGLSHSVLARPSVKRWLTAVVPVEAERSTYVIVASATLALLVWQWRAVPEVVWRVGATGPCVAIWSVHVTGIALIVVSTFLTDHFDLFGLRQVWLYAQGRPYTPVPFVERAIYRRVRHPMMLGTLVWLWATPVMTVGHLVFAAAMTAYVLVGVALEERGLSRTLGPAYDAYRRRVRAFVPIRRG